MLRFEVSSLDQKLQLSPLYPRKNGNMIGETPLDGDSGVSAAIVHPVSIMLSFCRDILLISTFVMINPVGGLSGMHII